MKPPPARPEAETTAPAARPVVFLHLGTPKSGTTFLQNVLWQHRSELREEGLLYPGRRYASHFWAALDLQGIAFGGHRDPAVEGAWERLVEQVGQWPGSSLISHEMFAPAAPEHVAKALEDLDFADVHLVLTARDLQRQIPAVWQEDLKNRHSVDYRTFLKALSDPAGAGLSEAEVFWRMQDLPAILARWDEMIPPDRVHVVTVPPPGAPHDLLWHRFAGLLGVDGASYDTSEVRSNPSLGAAEAGLLRRLNLVLGDRSGEDVVEWPQYERAIKLRVATRHLAPRAGKARFGLPNEEYVWVDRRSADFAETLAAAGYDVVGDLAELRPERLDPGRILPHPDDVPDPALLDVAVQTIAGLALELETELAEQREAFQQELAETREALWAAYDRPVWRHTTHKFARWFPPLRRLLAAGAAARQRRKAIEAQNPAEEGPLPWDTAAGAQKAPADTA